MLMNYNSTKLSMSRSQLREQICQTSKSDWQEWQSLVVLNGTNIFLKGTNISFLKFICEIFNRGVANSFWNHVIQISSRQMYFQDIYSNLWKVKLFSGNIYSFKSNTYFWGTVMFVQDRFLYLIVTRTGSYLARKGKLYLSVMRFDKVWMTVSKEWIIIICDRMEFIWVWMRANI
jgi:hypothetical protein